MSNLREDVVRLAARGLSERDAPIALASGGMSRFFIDGKAAFARGENLRLACQLLIETLEDEGISFDAIGGLTMGADAFAHGVAMLLPDVEWFSVRKRAKDRGTRKLVEGADLRPGVRVVLVDDVVTTGGSIQQAYEAVIEQGAEVVAGSTLVDRDEIARAFFDERGVPYLPLVTYQDLEIPAVSQESVPA